MRFLKLVAYILFIALTGVVGAGVLFIIVLIGCSKNQQIR